MTIWQRIKSSPVVQIQLIAIVATLVAYFFPELDPQIKAIMTALTAAWSVFAGLNNPTDKINF